jgi:hypothetical protein
MTVETKQCEHLIIEINQSKKRVQILTFGEKSIVHVRFGNYISMLSKSVDSELVYHTQLIRIYEDDVYDTLLNGSRVIGLDTFNAMIESGLVEVVDRGSNYV